MKERTWLSILLSYAGPCRGKMAASVALAVVSVAGGFVPYLGVYQILRLFVERRAGLEGILLWCGVCLAGYAVKVAGYALSTMLAHVSAYTILEGLRLQAADRLMGAPLGEVDSRPIGAMKSTAPGAASPKGEISASGNCCIKPISVSPPMIIGR